MQFLENSKAGMQRPSGKHKKMAIILSCEIFSPVKWRLFAGVQSQ